MAGTPPLYLSRYIISSAPRPDDPAVVRALLSSTGSRRQIRANMHKFAKHKFADVVQPIGWQRIGPKDQPELWRRALTEPNELLNQSSKLAASLKRTWQSATDLGSGRLRQSDRQLKLITLWLVVSFMASSQRWGQTLRPTSCGRVIKGRWHGFQRCHCGALWPVLPGVWPV